MATTLTGPSGVRNVDYYHWFGLASTAEPQSPQLTLSNTQVFYGGKAKRLAYCGSGVAATVTTPHISLIRPGSTVFTGFRARARFYTTDWSNSSNNPDFTVKTWNANTATGGAAQLIINVPSTASQPRFQALDNTGATATVATGSTVLTTSAWHLFELTVDSAGTSTAIVDGTTIGTYSTGATNWTTEAMGATTYIAHLAALGVTNLINTNEGAVTDLWWSWL